ncbi:MAG: hypothetical protein WDN04_16835 [Rhodospirillales bacterium]
MNNCWSVQVNNLSWFGPSAPPGTTTSAAIELNAAIDTRIEGLQAYFGHAAVLQTAKVRGYLYCRPVIVGTDYLFCRPTSRPGPAIHPPH